MCVGVEEGIEGECISGCFWVHVGWAWKDWWAYKRSVLLGVGSESVGGRIMDMWMGVVGEGVDKR